MGLSRTVSEIDGDFSRQLKNFPTRCILPPPADGISIGAGVRKNGMMRLPDGPKRFKICLAV